MGAVALIVAYGSISCGWVNGSRGSCCCRSEPISFATRFVFGYADVNPANGPESASMRSPLISARPVFEQRVVLATVHLLLTEGQGRGFNTSIPVVRVSTKLLKILIAALSPSVAY